MPQIRRIKSTEADIFRKIRLTALADSPSAFGSTLAEASLRSDSSWQEQVDASASGADRATFLAFDDDSPIALAAIYRDKESPKIGDLLQVWTSPTSRGTGVGQKIIQALLTWASENDFEHIRTEVLTSNTK